MDSLHTPLNTRADPAKTGLFFAFALLVLWLLGMRTGAAFYIFGFSSPDPCWLLRMGELIWKSGLPQHDCFSFTIPLWQTLGTQTPFVQYQWLSEVFFYICYERFHLVGLCSFVAAVSVLATICVAVRILKNAGAPIVWSLIAICAATTLSNLRAQVRPELFTYLGITLTSLCLQPLRFEFLATQTSGIKWRSVLALFVLYVAWSNLHSGFVVGLIILWLYSLYFLAFETLNAHRISYCTKTILISATCSTIATLINPYSFELWLYIGHLFTLPINGRIDELQPFSKYWPSIPFMSWASLLILLICIATAIKRSLSSTLTARSAALLTLSMTVIGLAAAASLSAKRLLFLLPILIALEGGNLLTIDRCHMSWNKIWRSRWSFLFLETAVIGSAVFGVIDTSRNVEIGIPIPTTQFIPPVAAVEFLSNHYSTGHIFCSDAVGSLIIFRFAPHDAVFLDTRLDAYPPQVFADYLSVASGGDKFKPLLDWYDIKWIVCLPREPIAYKLVGDSDWEMAFADETGRVFRRRDGTDAGFEKRTMSNHP